MTTYRIPSANLSRLTSDLESMNTRAVKLGLAPISYDILREETVERKTETGTSIRRFYHIAVTGGVAQLNGWHFVATITPTENGNLLAGIPGEVIPEQYREVSQFCDHCKTKRYRKATYIIRNDDGIYRQVGGNCLSDFVGYAATPSELAAMAEFEKTLAAIEEDDWLGFSGSRLPQSVDTIEFLATVASLARHSGFATRKMVENHIATRTTGDIAWDVCTGFSRVIDELTREGWEVTGEDTARAIAAIDWAKDLPTNGDTFTHNMRLSALNPTLESRGVGIAAYLIEAFRKSQETATRETLQTGAHVPAHVGEVGKRQVLENLTVARIREFDGMYGVTYFISMVTENGDEVIWKASTYQDWAYRAESEKTPVTLKATVKEHGEFRGVPQTVITRATLA